jgi:transcriptional regulator with XRE-family HTH domain
MARRTLPADASIGDRLKQLRTDRGLTQDGLAKLADLSRDIIAKLEQGQRASARLTTMVKIANALDVDLSELTGRRERMGGDRDGGRVLALRDAILSHTYLPGLDDVQDGEPTAAYVIERAVDTAWRRYWAGEFGPLLAAAPDLIGEARLAHAAHGAVAVRPLAMAYDLGANLLVQFGRNDLAALASERAIRVAHGGDDQNLWATMFVTYSWNLLHQGRMPEAETVAAQAAQRIEPSFSAPARDVAAWANLVVTALAPAAAEGRDVTDYIALATAAGERLGQRVPVFHTSFGPASAAMQATHAYAVRGEPAKAVKASRRLHPGDLSGISHGRHLLDVALAHSDAIQYRTAVERLLEARAQSAVWFRHQPDARSLVMRIRSAETRASPAIRSLAKTLAI